MIYGFSYAGYNCRGNSVLITAYFRNKVNDEVPSPPEVVPKRHERGVREKRVEKTDRQQETLNAATKT